MVEVTLRLRPLAWAPHKTIGLEKQSWFPTAAHVGGALGGALPRCPHRGCEFVLIAQVRLIKSEAKVGYLRRAGEIAEIEQRTALATMHDGVRRRTSPPHKVTAGR